MMAKVFQSGNSLALRLSKFLDFKKDDEVKITKIGKTVILTPLENYWDSTFEAVESFKGGVLKEKSYPFRREVLTKMLLDTNICIYILNNNPKHIKERFKKYKIGEIAVSSITVAELMFGVKKSKFKE